MNIKNNSILFNLLFWSAYFLYEWLANASIDDEYRRYFINAAAIVPMTMAAALFTFHVLFKKFYVEGKKQAFWAGLLASMVVFILARRGFNYFYTYPLYYPEGQESMSFLFFPKLLIEGVNLYLIVGLYSMFYIISAWYEQQRVALTLKQEKTETELELLKSQVQPHFIFNTLNNIYSYAIQNKSKTPDLIYRLSSFLSYSLYESKSFAVPVSKELDYINDYIELEKIRYGDRLDVSINIFHNLENFHISPLLILPLVENCFKHGFNSAVDNCWIRIDVSRKQDWLTIKIENSVENSNQNKESNMSGIGLGNVKRRLEIVYPESHEFKCIEEEDTFLTMLKIKDLRTVSTKNFKIAESDY